MGRHGSDRIHDLFSARACEVTPAPARHAARILYAPISRDSGFSRLCASVLSEAERERAGRFAARRDRCEFEQRRAFRRFCAVTALGTSRRLSEISFRETDNGRPYLREEPNLRFSFSSCRAGLLGGWSSTHGIGVDVEDPTRDLEADGLARHYFSKSEADEVEGASGRDRLGTFYQLWCLKEAALKSIGEGLPFGVDAFEFELQPAPGVVRVPPGHGEPERFEAHRVEAIEGCGALVTRRL